MKRHELVRVRHGKVIAGVCGGIARHFGWSPTLVRLAFILSCVLPGPQVLAYVVLWIVMPKEQDEEASTLDIGS